MGFFSDEHPYTAVTEYINRMTGEQYGEDDLSGLPDLIEVVKIQTGGSTEASRAIRKFDKCCDDSVFILHVRQEAEIWFAPSAAASSHDPGCLGVKRWQVISEKVW